MTDFPDDWPVVALGDVSTVIRGISYKSSELTDSSLGRPMVNLRSVGKGGGYRADGLKYFTGSLKESQVLAAGDLLVAMTDLSKAKDVLGSPIVVPSSLANAGATFSLDLSKVLPNEQRHLPRFLSLYLESPFARAHMQRNGRGITVMHLRTKALPELLIPLPPLDEQWRIVSILEDHMSRIDFGLRGIEVSVNRSQQVIASSRSVMWEASRACGDLVEVAALGRLFTGTTPSSRREDFYGSDIPFVTPADVGEGRRIAQWSRGLTDLGAQQSRTTRGPAVLAVCIGATLGKIGWVSTPVATNQQINVIEPVSDVASAEFIAALMASPQFQGAMWSASSSTTLPILNKGKFARLRLPVPTTAIQRDLLQVHTEWVASTARLRQESERAVRSVAALRTSLLHAAFSGQLSKEAARV